jgi:hypothetical protein
MARSSARRTETGTGTVQRRRKEDNGGGVVGDVGTDEPLPPPRRCQHHNDIIMDLPLSPPPPQRYTPPLVLTNNDGEEEDTEYQNQDVFIRLDDDNDVYHDKDEKEMEHQNQDFFLRLDEDDDDDEKEDEEEEEESVEEEMTDDNDDDDDDDGGDYYPSSKTLSGGDEIIIRHHEDEYNDGEGRGDDEEEGYSSNNSNKNSNSNNSSNSSNSSNNSTNNTLSYRKKGWIGIGLIILFTAAATVGILFWKQQQQQQQRDNANESNNNGSNNGDDDYNGDDGSITTTTVLVPTPSPSQSFSPTITFPYDSFDDYFNTLLQIVLRNVDSNNNINDPYVWTDPTTSQFDALRFVAYQDGSIRSSSDEYDDYYYGSKEMESKLLQRLGLLVLYYDTGGEFYWIQDELQTTTTDNVNVNTDYYNYDNNNKQTDYSDTDSDITEVEFIDWIRPGIDECDWIGIACNENGYIISLLLKERNIVGNKFIPSETLIWLGPHLEILDLSMNNLRGSIPNDFLFYNNNSNDDNENENENENENDGITAAVTVVSSFLPKLRILDLSKNELDGTIQEDIRYGLPSLQILKLSDNFLTGPLPLYVNTQVLEELYLDSNNFSGTLPFEQWLFASSIEILNNNNKPMMTSSTPTTTTPTTTPTSTIVEDEDADNANNEWLSSMEITMSIDKGETSAEQNNQVKQVGSNDNMRPTIGSYSNPNNNNSYNNINNDRSSLKVIDFSNNILTGTIPRTVAFNNNLEVLALQRNAELTGTIPTEIAVLTSLIQLQLSDCDLDGRLPLEFLLVMPKLERLIVAYNRLTGTIPGDIIFTNYRTINNDNNNDSSSNAILYPPLHGFNIGDNRMTGTLPTTLGLLRNLSYLQLFGNEFNGEIPTNYLLRGRNSSIDDNDNDNDNDNDSNNNDYDNIQRLWLHDNPNLFGSMPCPTDTDVATLGQQKQESLSSSSLGDGNVADYKAVNNSEEAQQQHESSTIFLDYASDCSSNPNIICPCCNRCF